MTVAAPGPVDPFLCPLCARPSLLPAQLLVSANGQNSAPIELNALADQTHILTACDLFLLPSETESFGLAALEAMACGVPVLASAVGGLPEVVVHGETGFLTPKGDVDAMIAHGLRVLRDAALQARMRDAAARRALEFSADRIVPRYERVYEDVLRG